MTQDLLTRRVALSAALAIIPFGVLAQNSASDPLRGLLNRIPGATPGRNAGSGATLSQSQIGLGLKDALKVASQRVVGRIGKADGYNGDPAIRIPLPPTLQKIEGPLKAIGASGMLDELRLKMNRAAEQAAPKALDIFVDAASKMTFDDARMILSGPQDSATQYFKRTTSSSLTSSFRPIVDTALNGVGAVMALNAVQTRAKGIPFVGQSIGDFSLSDFTVGKALDGLFHYLAVEEGAIRTNPLARTTNLLKQVFA
ncbi:MAG TPA: DUF4197 domain-containing protein [Micropepsaceae bacterium]|jgi:hypothetical protein|nr:DUF4197 domain-containing protein [Micropepsaceae bacterium]